jgi:Rrf2 family protein
MLRTETRQCLRVLTALAKRDQPVVVAELAYECVIPPAMLAKILHRLAVSGFVRGRPGPGGGYVLVRPAGEIRLREVVLLTEGPEFVRSCLFGLPKCSDESPCPLHHHWSEIARRVHHLIDDHSIADLAAGILPLLEEKSDGRGLRP